MTAKSMFRTTSTSAQIPQSGSTPTQGTDTTNTRESTTWRTRARSTGRMGALLLAATMLGGIGATAVLGGTAEAVPSAQSTCAFGVRSLTGADGWQSLGLGVSIHNGTATSRVIAQLAADIGVDSHAEVRVGYSIDGGPVQEKVYGPGNLANNTEFWQTRSTLAVIPLASGSHTVTPYWRISGSGGSKAAFEGGCFTVEGRTS
jgi:hypothetical protein